MTSGRFLRATTNGSLDAWQTFDGVDRPVWMEGGSRPTSLAQYEADFPSDRVALISVVVPASGAEGDTVYLDRVLVGTSTTTVYRYDLEPLESAPRSVPRGTCQASPMGGGSSGGGTPRTG